MTNQHHAMLCPSCQRPFITDRQHELCMHCLMLTYEQAAFTGVDAPSYLDAPTERIREISEDAFVQIAKRNEILDVIWIDEATDDATPTERLDTNGGDDEVS